MRRFALIVLLSVFATFLGVDGHETAPAAHAAFARGNGRLLVREDIPLNFRLASVEPDGSDFRTLGDGFYGSWSPDGRKIAFYTAYTDDISIMDADGSNVTPILTGPTLDVQPAWSPDGERIAFISDRDGSTVEGKVGIYTAKADGTDVVQLTHPDAIAIEHNTPPKWSPDGSKIIFTGQEPHSGLGWDVYSVPAAGGGLTRLTNTVAAAELYPEWSPDGSKIAFANRGEDPWGIWVMSAGGGGATKIATVVPSSVEGGGQPVWSPDGERIAYTEITSPIGTLPRTAASYVMDPNGGNKQALPVPGIIRDWQPVPPTKVEFTQAIQELQSISDLQADLAGDGKPPVPIIAGKPAAMRVLFDKVDTAKTYVVEVSGEFNGSETVTLTPGCTQVQRRKQEAGCTSVDFYFTPPQGNWSVTLRVKEGGTLVEEHEFNLTSEETDDLVLKAVSVCDAMTPGLLGTWQCQDPAPLFGMASLLRRVLPTSSVSVQLTGNQVRQLASSFAQPIDWWGQINRDLQAMYGITDALAGLAGQETYYFGLTRTAAPGSTLGAAYLNTRGAASNASYAGRGYEAISWVVAHEMGHAMGRDHTNTGDPPTTATRGCWLGTGTQVPAWPYADNMLRSGPAPGVVEVGFDVASKTAVPGDQYFEMMGYCASPPPSAATADIVSWISPFTTLQLLEPSGPLGLPAQPATASGGFWFVRGTLDHESGAAEIEPLLQFELEAPVEPGSGSHRIEVQDVGGAALFTRFFTPAHGHGSPSPGDPVLETEDAFSELIPVQAGAAAIVVIDDTDAEIGAITLDGAAPAVTITQAANDGDVVSLEWSVDDPDSAQHTYWVDYSPDGGDTWQNQAMGLSDAALALDTDLLAESGNAVVRVIASDGVNSGEAISAPFSVAGKLPEGDVIGPSGSLFRSGDLVWLEAAAWDVDDGTLDDGSVTWSSSRDGNLGAGASLPVYDLSVGTHTITMTAKDSDDNAATDSITVTVFDGPIIEGEPDVLSGDVDCGGAVNAIDALKLLRHVAGLDVAQTEPCPDIGTGDGDIFGDVNCDGNITAVDALFVLRFVAALPVSLPAGCRPVGT